MKRLFLVFGPPNSGKSYLAKKLKADYSFQRLSVDAAYVQFIKSDCPMLYFEALPKYILPHYLCIRGYRRLRTKILSIAQHLAVMLLKTVTLSGANRVFVRSRYREHSTSQFGRDFVAEWHSHLLGRVRTLASQNDDVVVEGCLLEDCKDRLQTNLQNVAEVFQIRVENGQYEWQQQLLTLEQVAGLGAQTTPGG